MTLTSYTFPHAPISVDDQSTRPLPPPEPLGLHQPIFFVFAERGPIGIPVSDMVRSNPRHDAVA